MHLASSCPIVWTAFSFDSDYGWNWRHRIAVSGGHETGLVGVGNHLHGGCTDGWAGPSRDSTCCHVAWVELRRNSGPQHSADRLFAVCNPVSRISPFGTRWSSMFGHQERGVKLEDVVIHTLMFCQVSCFWWQMWPPLFTSYIPPVIYQTLQHWTQDTDKQWRPPRTVDPTYM